MNQPRMISGVYNLANGPPPTGTDADRRNHAARAELWHRLGLIVIDPADLTDGWLAQAVTNEAERRYGRRGGPTATQKRTGRGYDASGGFSDTR